MDARLVILGEGPLRAQLPQRGRGAQHFPQPRDARLCRQSVPIHARSQRRRDGARSSRHSVCLGRGPWLRHSIVAMDTPTGPREITENGKWGRLVPVGNAQASAGSPRPLPGRLTPQAYANGPPRSTYATRSMPISYCSRPCFNRTPAFARPVRGAAKSKLICFLVHLRTSRRWHGPRDGPPHGRKRRPIGRINARFARFTRPGRFHPLAPRHVNGHLPDLVERSFGKVALVHVNVGDHGSMLRKGLIIFASRLAAVPVLLHLHAVQHERFYASSGRLQRLFIRNIFHTASLCVGLGKNWEQWLLEVIQLPPQKVATLSNGVCLPMICREDHAEREEVQILFLGNLLERKGVSDLITALSNICQTPPWRLTLAGGGDIPHYRQIAETLRIGANVNFVGWLIRQRCSTC